MCCRSVKELTKSSSQELIGNEWLFDIRQSMRGWTRGDGSRYKDWPSIRSGYKSKAWDEKETNRDLSKAPDNINDFADVLDYLWIVRCRPMENTLIILM